MTYGQSSGTTSWKPLLSDLAIDILERCGIYDIESKHMFSVRRSMNLRLQHWGVKGINLFRVDKTPTAINLIPGQAVYDLPSDTVSMLDTYRRTPGMSTQASTIVDVSSVTIGWANHGFTVGTVVPFIDPVSVGGLTIAGNQVVASVPDTNSFTISTATPAASTDTVTINAMANNGVTDVFMSPQSRTDYASQANKSATGAPTTYWFQKLVQPQIAVWPTPDTAQPYQVQTYLCRQIEDADPANGQTPSLPQRFWYAFVADVAADMAFKFAPNRLDKLKLEATQAWQEAALDDTERVSMNLVPTFPSVC